MKILLSLLLVANFSISGQVFKPEHVQRGDSLIERYVSGNHEPTNSSNTLRDASNKILEQWSNGFCYTFNNKTVPLGFYCDTTYQLVDNNSKSDLRYFRIVMFSDRKIIFQTIAIIKYRWVHEFFIDTDYFDRILNPERSVATDAKSGK